jgi:sporulation protein YtfJ
MSSEQHVENLMKSTMENLKDMIDVNTVIGEAIETKDGTCIIPVSRLSFGFASGGSEYANDKASLTSTVAFPFGGGSGAGVSVKPVAFLVVKQDGVRMLPVDQDSTYDRIVDTVPQVLDIVKSFAKDFCNKNKNNNQTAGNTTNMNATAPDTSTNMTTDTTERCYYEDRDNI